MSSSSKRREMDLMKLSVSRRPEEDKGLPDAYPYKSPTIGFVNKIYHPNVDEMSCSVCLDVINQTWSPMFDLVNLFEVFFPQLLLYPNPSDPLNGEAAALMMRDKTAYVQRVKAESLGIIGPIILLALVGSVQFYSNPVFKPEYCEKYAKLEDIGAAAEKNSSNEEQSEDGYASRNEEVAGKADP